MKKLLIWLLVLTSTLIPFTNVSAASYDSYTTLMNKYSCTSTPVNIQFNTGPNSASTTKVSDFSATISWTSGASTTIPNGSIKFYIIETYDGDGIWIQNNLTVARETSGAGSVTLDLPQTYGESYMFQVKGVAYHPDELIGDDTPFNCSSTPIKAAGTFSTPSSAPAPEPTPEPIQEPTPTPVVVQTPSTVTETVEEVKEEVTLEQDQNNFTLLFNKKDDTFKEFTIINTKFGSIKFINELLLTDTDIEQLNKLSDYITIENGVIEINTESLSVLANNPASLTMTGLSFKLTPKILINGEEDIDNIISNIVYDTNTGTLTFDIKHFTRFEVVESIEEKEIGTNSIGTNEENNDIILYAVIAITAVTIISVTAILIYKKKKKGSKKEKKYNHS